MGLDDPPYYFTIKVRQKLGGLQGILSPGCSSGDKECKFLSVFWLALIHLVFDTPCILSNTSIYEGKLTLKMEFPLLEAC